MNKKSKKKEKLSKKGKTEHHNKKENYKINKKSRNKENKKESKKEIKKGTKKEITLEEVKKHNKKTDAWIVIEDKVYDVTSWIENHPGGLIIMRGVGKDATILFKKFRHSKNAENILKKFYIAELKK